MQARFRFLDGPNTGRKIRFGEGVKRIVIGRDASSCQLAFPADERRVGRQHCVIERKADHYRLNLDGVHQVLVDGRRAEDGEELRESCTLRISSEGPQLEMVIERPVAQATLPDPVPPPAERRSGGKRGKGGKIGGGYTVMLQRMDAKISRSRRIAALAILLALVGGGAVAWTLLQPKQEPVVTVVKPPPPPPAKPTMQQVLKAVQESVYLVVLRDNEGRETAQATAWVVGDALLATNSHVAELYVKKREDETMLVRSTGATPADHTVHAVQLHPGYAAAAELWAEYIPAREGSGGRWEAMHRIPACDVATLAVADDAKLGPPLTLADADTTAALDSGEAVGFVGFPMENLAMGGVNVSSPTPTTQIGTLTAVTDFFLGRKVAADCQLVQHSLPAAGGASGSPILNQDGVVVAVLSGGNVVMSEEGRIATGAGVNFAQRVDLLQELIAGQADAAQAERSERWRESIQQFESLRTHIVPIMIEDWLKQLGTAGPPTSFSKQVSATDTAAEKEPWHYAIIEFELPSKGNYLLTGVGTPGHEIDVYVSQTRHDTIEALVRSGDIAVEETGTGWMSSLTVSWKYDDPVTVYVYVVTDRKDLPVTMQLHRAE